MSRPTNPAPWKHRKLHRNDTHGTGSVMWGHPNTSAETVLWAETVSCRKVSHACRAVAQFFGLSCSRLYAGMFHVRSRGSMGNVNTSSFSSRVFRHFVGSSIAGSPGSRSQDLGSTGSEKSMDKMASTRTEVAS